MKKNSVKHIYRLTIVAVMAALAIAIQMLIPEIQIFPPSYKLGFSMVPAIISALVCDPVSGMLVVVITNIVDFIGSDSAGMGQVINTAMGVPFIFFFMSFYRLFGKKSAAPVLKAKPYFLSALITVPLTAIVGIVANFIILPIYLYIMAGNAVDYQFIVNTVMFASVPFNLLKYGLLTVAFYPVYYAVMRSVRYVMPHTMKTV